VKLRDREIDIFSLSFLDIVSCAFGAVVLLLVISKPEMETEGGVSESMELLRKVYRAEAENIQIAKLNEQERLKLDGKKNKNDGLADQVKDVEQNTRSEEFKAAALAKAKAQIEKKKQELEIIAKIKETTPNPVPTEEVGGIVVDSDYVIFVIDTSGSMRDKWKQVKSVIDRVLTMHPQVKGFQIINDNGLYLKKKGGWIPDTKTERSLALIQTNRWSPVSNSSPYEGVAEALRAYGRNGRKLAIYVFGDDFSSGRFDDTAASISSLNMSSATGKRFARIHGIGFTSRSTRYNRVDRGGYTFALLMSAVARENGGTYLGLSN